MPAGKTRPAGKEFNLDDLCLFSLSLLALSLLATGVVAGIIAGLLGVGGGIVIVPVLYYMYCGR